MYTIKKITSCPTVDFAAEELKKYLRMMMPRCGEIKITYDPKAVDGFRLGLMEDFGLDVSEAEDITLDDIIHIDADAEGGIIAGSNARSVLLAVYKYLTLNGCRWLFPGIDGEVIPIRDIEPTKYHKMADCRYRGQCNEGGEYQPNMIEAIEFTPKIGMNVFMMEFLCPHVYYDLYYNHTFNEKNREAEPVTMKRSSSGKSSAKRKLLSAVCSSTISDTAGPPKASVLTPNFAEFPRRNGKSVPNLLRLSSILLSLKARERCSTAIHG
jgi:hypothetical protein